MPQIIPIKDLKNTSEISEMCHRATEPIYVTKNGYGDMVIMSLDTYEATMKQLSMYRDIEISEKQIEQG
ncbi:prevent-host-death family protein [Catonella morbi ATCC 51271]|uniref:Antitoxin n=1 Tax=Catonella morbi ATCC 51271 TaxID=592026 RepID=V2Y2Q7_9FIRM|nr:type II toxin-antitoxin system prevent-host-death family antitoxin [Catonella morbi]ESL02342.1 prevent-host-death family protein [Catonella morbi ATCC 51271]